MGATGTAIEEHGGRLSFLFAYGDGATAPRFEGVAYPTMPTACLGGRLVVDLDTLAFKDRVAVLGLGQEEPLGFTDSIKITRQGLLVAGFMLDTGDAAIEATALGRQGFPFQVSVEVAPGSIEEVATGGTVFATGHEIQGPVRVLRDGVLVAIRAAMLGVDGCPQPVWATRDDVRLRAHVEFSRSAQLKREHLCAEGYAALQVDEFERQGA